MRNASDLNTVPASMEGQQYPIEHLTIVEPQNQ